MAAKSPSDIEDLTLSLVVKVNGAVIPDYYPQLSVEIYHELNKVSHAELSFADGAVDTGTFPISDSEDFVPGNEIEILAGYGSEDKSTIFSGVVVKQGIEVNSENTFSLLVTCKHKAILMTMDQRNAEYSAMTDSDIISKIIKANGLKGVVSSTAVVQETVNQKGATDWDFVLARAEFFGFLVNCVKGNELNIGAPDVSGTPVLRLALGESIISFQAELDAQRQSPELEAVAWDIKTLETLSEQAAEPSVNPQGDLSPKKLSGKLGQGKHSLFAGTPMEKSEIKVWADAALLKMRLSALKGNVSFQGSGLVLPGKLVELEGVGSRYNGKAFVSSVTHTISDGKWITNVGFGLSTLAIAQRENFNSAPAAGQLPAVSGLQIATVKNLYEDPQSLYRIQLTLNSGAGTQKGTWARVSNFYATADAGSGFLPEVGDEVVVGFLDSNPRYPVVLGALYSSSKKPVNTPEDNNNYLKSIITKGKLKISFDDEKKVTTISTPGGNMFLLDDGNKKIEIKDQHGNFITMGVEGIAISSEKDISLTAKGGISMSANTKIDLAAKADLTFKGANISHTAQMGFTATGTASAQLSSSGQTVVKGTIVMIN